MFEHHNATRNLFFFLCGLIILFNLLDGVFTYTLLIPETEANPIVRYIWENFGFVTVAIGKSLAVIFTLTVLTLCYNTNLTLTLIGGVLASLISFSPIVLFIAILLG